MVSPFNLSGPVDTVVHRVPNWQRLCHLFLEFLAQCLSHRFYYSVVFIFVLVNKCTFAGWCQRVLWPLPCRGGLVPQHLSFFIVESLSAPHSEWGEWGRPQSSESGVDIWGWSFIVVRKVLVGTVMPGGLGIVIGHIVLQYQSSCERDHMTHKA